MTQIIPEDYFVVFSVEEAAEYLRVATPRVVNGWIKDGSLKAKKVGRRWLITKAALKEFVAPEGEPKIDLKYVDCPLGIYKCIYCATKEDSDA